MHDDEFVLHIYTHDTITTNKATNLSSLIDFLCLLVVFFLMVMTLSMSSVLLK